ncbi:hypothetical protein EYR41_001610 [Orbilia oligospora]|uniref:Uncharacterized protein n=1 Tax=Orbilia oligospora TaxID=2813651 RepID=A0A8H2EBP2_ORBOL|nr:hypothetical protein EYR41_001610 [Orbilia oligospora]
MEVWYVWFGLTSPSRAAPRRHASPTLRQSRPETFNPCLLGLQTTRPTAAKFLLDDIQVHNSWLQTLDAGDEFIILSKGHPSL